MRNWLTTASLTGQSRGVKRASLRYYSVSWTPVGVACWDTTESQAAPPVVAGSVKSTMVGPEPYDMRG